MLSCSAVSDSVILWVVAHQVPLSTGILQARILEWVAFPFSSRYKVELKNTEVDRDSWNC